MSLHAVSRRLQPALRHKSALRWGGALAAGLVALNCRFLATGNIRGRVTSRGHSDTIVRDLSSRAFNSITHRSYSLFSAITSTPSMSLTPPQPPPSWNHTPEDILALTKDLIVKDRAIQDKVGALEAKDCTYESVNNCIVTNAWARS